MWSRVRCPARRSPPGPAENARVYLISKRACHAGNKLPRRVGALFDTEFRQSVRAAGTRLAVDLVVEASAMAVHGDQQGPEALHPELPEGLRVQVVEIHVLDRLHPGRLQGCRPPDDGQVGASQLPERVLRTASQPTLADDEPDSILH